MQLMGGTTIVFSNEALQMLCTFNVCVVDIINLQYEYSISSKQGLYVIVPTHKSPSHLLFIIIKLKMQLLLS